MSGDSDSFGFGCLVIAMRHPDGRGMRYLAVDASLDSASDAERIEACLDIDRVGARTWSMVRSRRGREAIYAYRR